jgi:hypothetical protein
LEGTRAFARSSFDIAEQIVVDMKYQIPTGR